MQKSWFVAQQFLLLLSLVLDLFHIMNIPEINQVPSEKLN